MGTVQRSHSTVRPPEVTGELPGDIAEPVSPAELPSPRWLLEEVRAPGVARAEVDALLSGLERPLGPGESARERADLLHEIMADEQVRDYTGRGGRKVGHVAVLRLGELGFPYALEVPPELFAQARAAGGAESPEEASARHRQGRVLACIAGGLEVLPGFFFLLNAQSRDVDVAVAWILGAFFTSFVPALLADIEPVLRRRWLHYLLLLAVALPALGWLLVTILVAGATAGSGAFPAMLFSVLPLGMALLRLGGAKGLYGPPPDAEPPESEPG